MSEKATVGVPSWTCHCGDHCFAYPHSDAFEFWQKTRVTNPTVRRILQEKGRLVDEPPPPPEPHVILLSPDDAWLFKLRRWRVFNSPARKKATYEVKRGIVGKALQRLVLPDAPIVQFVSGNGCDCRRSNLKATTMKEVCSDRRSRRTAVS